MASAALLAAGCSTENKAEGTEYGTLKVSCTADGSIDAASDDTSRMPAAPSVPQTGDFTLTVTGESGTQKWDTLAEFEQSETVFRMGAYTVSVAHGDPDAEGIDKPYYAAEKSVEVLPRRAATVEMTATIAIATHGYDYKVTIDGTEKSGSFTAGAAQTIPNADMSGWSMTSGFAYPNAEGGAFWSSGNNTMTKTLCTSTDVKFGKAAPAAKLTSTNMLVLAAGNLFTGTFAYKSFTGTVQFGQPYDFTVRPSALKVKYHAKVGTVDKVRTSGDICPYIKKGDPDMARIFVAIVDWNAPHQVVSAMTTTKGAWDPEKGIDNVSEGKILGYGSLWITQSTEGDDMQDAELEIVWYDHETRPSGGGYSLVISCACNAYGDYFTGCSTNVMYVDDFEWVY